MGPQIPANLIANKTLGKGKATIKIPSRSDSTHSGAFNVSINVHFDPVVDPYPAGTVKITIDLSDSFCGVLTSTMLFHLSSTGKHTPTMYLSGRCTLTSTTPRPLTHKCQFWLSVANNKRTRDLINSYIVSFLVVDKSGTRVAYGTGPIIQGTVHVQAFC